MQTDEWIAAVTNEIGGCRDLIKDILDEINIAKSPPLRQSLLPRSKGIVLHGKPGTGKTALALAIAKYSGLPYHVLNSPDIFQSEQGASERRLLSFFQQSHGSIVILDEMDMIAGREASVASVLRSVLDSNADFLYLIGLTSRLHAVDKTFLRSGRLDHVRELVVKTPSARREILEIMTRNLPLGSDRDRVLHYVAQVTHGFVPSDLHNLCTQVVLKLIQESATVAGIGHFEYALGHVRPSTLNEYKVPQVRFSELFGLDATIQELKSSVIHPFHHPEQYMGLGITPPRGILVHGPPGVGKTMLCRALAFEAGVNFMFVESSQIRSKIVGESESNLARLFAQARSNAPCILFIDQIDMLLPRRGTSSSSENTSDRIVTSFLTAMDGLLTKTNMDAAHIDVLVVGATNRIEAMDPAVLRPGRFDEHIHVPIPESEQRLQIIDGLCTKMPTVLSEQERLELSKMTEEWTGADLDNLFREAALASLRENVHSDKITFTHIQKVIKDKR
ncbi:P-loop containing nucleoside triphosphate hydrolase protein [Dichotomocladium elegans]|nr:P-loop containing nucleoside triphosphate hydrolase protein [Dichotomocladium elegans]